MLSQTHQFPKSPIGVGIQLRPRWAVQRIQMGVQQQPRNLRVGMILVVEIQWHWLASISAQIGCQNGDESGFHGCRQASGKIPKRRACRSSVGSWGRFQRLKLNRVHVGSSGGHGDLHCLHWRSLQMKWNHVNFELEYRLSKKGSFPTENFNTLNFYGDRQWVELIVPQLKLQITQPHLHSKVPCRPNIIGTVAWRERKFCFVEKICWERSFLGKSVL